MGESLGAEVRIQQSGTDCVVSHVYEGGAASLAGISAGDILVAIDPLSNLNLKPISFLLLITVLNPKPALRQVLLCFACDIMTVLRVLMFVFTVLYFENL